ncbi:hypothetical protein ACI780_10840 [Geodermatophilus sp. SYSU D00814]
MTPWRTSTGADFYDLAVLADVLTRRVDDDSGEATRQPWRTDGARQGHMTSKPAEG